MLLSIKIRNSGSPVLPVTCFVCVQDVYIHQYRFHAISSRYAVRSTHKFKKNRAVRPTRGGGVEEYRYSFFNLKAA